MSIKKEVLWDAKRQKFAGNTDYGPILAEDQDVIAHNALVVMAVDKNHGVILLLTFWLTTWTQNASTGHKRVY